MTDFNATVIADEIEGYLHRLFPLCRSITGNGNRETLRILKELVPLDIVEYPTGQQVYDWMIPREWNIRDAWIKNSSGKKIIDFQKSNLHVVSYSAPVQDRMKLVELNEHIHFRDDLPSAIPYRTSYYNENWGFCLSYNDYKRYFNDTETYEVFIDSELQNGSLTIGELLIKGKSDKEYLISTYICHPSLANDNLSGPVMTAMLSRELLSRELNFSYRVVFVPETIGAIAYCANNEEAMKRIMAGFVVSSVGGPGRFGYRQSWQQDCFINSMVEDTFHENGIDNFKIYPFDIHGSDERQYSSQGFRINIVSVTKDKYYDYDYYHTSLDDLSFISAENIVACLKLYIQTIEKLDKNVTYKNLHPNCEIMLSKHDLYQKTGGGQVPIFGTRNDQDLILWLLFYCDGQKSLWQISKLLETPIDMLYNLAVQLSEKKLFKEIDDL
jgi:aminopeptidase-like protein